MMAIHARLPALTRRRVSVLAAGLMVIVVLVWAMGFSSLLGVRHVRVHGNATVSAADVLVAAAVHKGTPLLRVDTDAIAERVTRALPELASVTVSTALPATVRITVVERVAVGYVGTTNTQSPVVLVDKTGRQFRSVNSAPDGLPRFDIPTQSTGSDSAADATGQAVASVAAALPSSLLSKLSSIAASTPDAITLKLADGRLVRWGSATQNAQKAAILPVLLTHPGTTFDLSDPAQVYSH